MTDPSSPLPPSQPSKPTHLWRYVGQIFSTLIRLIVLIPVITVIGVFIPGPAREDTSIVFARGTPTAVMGAELSNGRVVYLGLLFRVAAKLVAHGYLKAGEYAIPAHASAADIAQMMHDGRSVVRMLTIAEGLTSSEIVRTLNENTALTGTIEGVPSEGSLLPETYRYDYGDGRGALIARMDKAMQERLTDIWAGRDSTISLRSPQELVVLASIVEKETGKADERPRIAGVFYNRLRLNMRLQSDPTVIYALTKGHDVLERPLTHEDLAYASPMNTYASDGLPPQPICSPGVAALMAAAHPERHSFLYFVADGTGGHAFAADLATQDQNINRWHQAVDKAGGANDHHR